jgi:hypothetical protein
MFRKKPVPAMMNIISDAENGGIEHSFLDNSILP